jgi:hypothetical protein
VTLVSPTSGSVTLGAHRCAPALCCGGAGGQAGAAGVESGTAAGAGQFCCALLCDECIDRGSLSGGTVTVSADPVCLNDTITFTASGVQDSGGYQRENCVEQDILPGTINYEWTITKPDGTMVNGTGSVATILADQPGTYSCMFTAETKRDCPPQKSYTLPGATAETATATIDLNPSAISATTPWPNLPGSFSQSDITVTWDLPDCVGTLQIVELEPSTPGGYLPTAGQGTLDQNDDTHWVYTAFGEPSPVVCENRVKVWIAAKYDDLELTRKSILVLPVHTYLTTGATANFQMDYNYISWKYAAVLATTGGAFAGPPTITVNPQVSCAGVIGYACTTCIPLMGCDVTFGTLTFTGSENQAASIIGHELLHTTGADECPAYRWEAEHCDGTGVCPCDAAPGQYLDTVLQYLIAHECP